jgi:uncharacterized protein (DUF305 family)
MKLATLRSTLVSAAIAAAIAGCSADDRTSGMPGHDASAPGATSSTNTAGQINDTDVMFAQMMIPHHNQAVDRNDMVLSKTGVHPQVTSLINQIKAAQQPEIDSMNAWLDAWGRQPMDEGGSHHGGDGTITEEEMRQLDMANGTDGQRLFLRRMIKHHQGAIHMAQTEIASGKNPDARAQLLGLLQAAGEGPFAGLGVVGAAVGDEKS